MNAARRGAASVAASLLAATLLAGCRDDTPAPLADCGGRLGGVWRVEGQPLRFHAIATRAGWELLPVVDDGHLEPATAGHGPRMVAPGALELPHTDGATAERTGSYARRYEQDGAICVVTTPVRLHGCAGQRVALDVTPPAPPADFADCASAPRAPVVTWTLVRER